MLLVSVQFKYFRLLPSYFAFYIYLTIKDLSVWRLMNLKARLTEKWVFSSLQVFGKVPNNPLLTNLTLAFLRRSQEMHALRGQNTDVSSFWFYTNSISCVRSKNFINLGLAE